MAYAWSVTRDGQDFASGSGSTFTAFLADQGTYAIALAVTDESGNVGTATATVPVTNAAPRLNPTAFGTATPLGGGLLTVGAGALGTAIATGNGLVLAGEPGFDPKIGRSSG